MEFIVAFYESASGRCPVRDFLEEAKESDADCFAAVLDLFFLWLLSGSARDNPAYSSRGKKIGLRGIQNEQTNKF